MSEQKTNICPCCPKGCDLSNLRCGRGEAYVKTGIIPENRNRNHHHEEHSRSNDVEMSIDEKLFALLNRLGRAGHGASDGKSSQNRILQILRRSGCMTQHELTEQLGIQPGSVSEILKKLEAAGLITRQSNSEDRRTVDIALTDTGRVQAEANRAQHTNHILFESLTDDEKQHLLSLLEKVGRDWHTRFRGEGRHKHKHHGERECEHKQSRGCKHSKEHYHGGKNGHDSDHGHGPKQCRGHHHDSF